MQFRENLEDRQFRERVREWLHSHKPKEFRPDSFDGQIEFDRAWQRTQYEGGWAGISWPKQYGGCGLAPSQQLIWCEEYAAARCPPVHDSFWLGLNHAGPTLIVRGTEAQKAAHLPKILRGETAWCQGFSEPNAGSDLASLRTRGVVDGDALVVNGQKIWTTNAQLSDFQELLVRTGTPESRHRGLTWVICDMRYPGIRVRPIRALDGRYHNCEVFYDNVRIPLSNVVGEIDGGWSVAMTTFGFERGPAAFGDICELEVFAEELIELARMLPRHGRSGESILQDQSVTTRLGGLRAQVQSLRALMYLMVSANEAGVDLGADGSILHLPFSEAYQALTRLAMEILGPHALSRTRSQTWVWNYLNAFCATLAGGTSEILRNVIGERLLGLPR
jgi:alkylation response protein AidB-like acyl-CoA dehydrogenase